MKITTLSTPILQSNKSKSRGSSRSQHAKEERELTVSQVLAIERSQATKAGLHTNHACQVALRIIPGWTTLNIILS
jgi:hypothetical protein